MKSDKKLIEDVESFLGSEVGAEFGSNFVSDEFLSYGALRDFYGKRLSNKEIVRAAYLLEASVDLFFEVIFKDDRKIIDRADKIAARYERIFSKRLRHRR